MKKEIFMKRILFFCFLISLLISFSAFAETRMEKIKLNECLRLPEGASVESINYSLSPILYNGKSVTYNLSGELKLSYVKVENSLLIFVNDFIKTVDKTNISEEEVLVESFTYGISLEPLPEGLRLDEVLDSEDEAMVKIIKSIEKRLTQNVAGFIQTKKHLVCK